MLWYALTQYHLTLKRVLEAVLERPNLLEEISMPDKKGRNRVNRYALSRLLYQIAPKGWALAPLRDYLIGDAIAALLSHFKKLEKGKHASNPPTMAQLAPMSDEEYRAAYEQFCKTEDFPLKPQQEEKIAQMQSEGKTRVAERMGRIYRSWAASRAAGELLRTSEGRLPRPLEFTRPELERGFSIARKGNDYFALVRLFASGHRYHETKILADGFIDWRTREAIGGRKYSGVILPLELGREFHQSEYLDKGTPQSAKLLARRRDDGDLEFYVHVAFEFTAEPIVPRTVLGLDRGAAMIGAGTLIDSNGTVVLSGIDLQGHAFSTEMARLRSLIAGVQRRGRQRGRLLRLRGRKAEIAIGEYANRVVELAAQHASQIVIERVDATSMSRFLTQSQFAKLRQKLTYKAARVGLPAPIEVPAAYTSQTCAQCGHKARENRPKRDEAGRAIQDRFCCVQCGYTANADQNASLVIALRGLHQQLKGGKFQKFEPFQQWLKSLGRDNLTAQAASS
jgi:IS605 OrfB family transposase